MLPDDGVRSERTVHPTFEGGGAGGASPAGVAAETRELATVADVLARAGSVARDQTGGTEPAPAFAAVLRARLLAGYGAGRGTAALPAGASPADRADGSAAAGAPIDTGVTQLRRASRLATRSRFGPPVRWLSLAAAAVLVVGLVAAWTRQTVPSPTYHAADVGAATLVRDGVTEPLAAGTELQIGDEIRVAPDGRATLALGSVIARLAGGTMVRIVALDASAIRIEQLAGRAYHRIAGPVAYRVDTGPVSWTADGTAFDLSREASGRGAVVRLLAVEHDVAVEGPALALRVAEGQVATVGLDDGASSLEPAVLGDLADPWLLANARIDRALGLGLGVLADLDELAHASPSPTAEPSPDESAEPSHEASHEPAPSVEPTEEPSHEPSPPPEPTASAKPTATPKPTPAPTATPKPTATPTPGIAMTLTSCNGGVVIEWTKYTGANFNHYSTYRSTSPFAVPERYPPDWPVEYLHDTYTTDPRQASAADTTGDVGRTYYYRALVFDAADRVIAASDLGTAKASPIGDLGALAVGPADGGTQVSWTAFSGSTACFTKYIVVWSASSSEPSYFGDHDGMVGVGTKSTTSTVLSDLHPGTTYWFRVQVLRATVLGTFRVAESEVAEYTVP